jgi:hypothetical protein
MLLEIEKSQYSKRMTDSGGYYPASIIKMFSIACRHHN